MNNNRDSLGDRMKGNYENRSKTYLVRRMPVIIRIDGKAFHTFTRGFRKPFDDILVKSMQETMKYLCENIQGCVLGYTQSDEITLVLTDYKTLTTDAWFDYSVQKMCSIAASMATMAFNKFFNDKIEKFGRANIEDWDEGGTSRELSVEEREVLNLTETYYKAYCKGAMFDARCFNIPVEEVTNCLIWRQQDAVRNSIQSVGQANFSHKELNCKTCNNIQDMLMTEKGINWNDYPTTLKRGSCCIKTQFSIVDLSTYNGSTEDATRTCWVIDNEIPIFTQNRDYIESRINF